MKKKLISIVIVVFCFPLQVFSQDIETFIKKLFESSPDSIYTKFEKFVLKNNDIKMEQRMLDFLIKNKRNPNSSSRKWTACFLVTMSENCKELKIKQESLYHAIDMHFVTNYGFACYPKEVFTDKTIELILSILGREIKDEEYALRWGERDKLKKFDNDVVREEQKKLNCSKQTAIDSLLIQYKRKTIENFYYSEEHTDKYIRLLGWLGKKEYASMLEKLLDNKRYEGKKKTLCMALAKLRYKDYFEKIFAIYPDDFEIPRYINTCDAWWGFIEVNKKFDVIKARDFFGKKSPTTRLSWAIFYMSIYVRNFPREPYFYGFAEKEDKIPQLIENTKKAYKWIEENKQNLEMRDWKEFCL